MQQRKRRTKGLGLVILIMAILIGFKCQEIVLSPNSLLFGDSSDGFRSYMAAEYHLKHDSTYHYFTGMNYPYGDRNDYTDNLPIVVNPVKFISKNIVDITPWFTGIWNYFMLLSLLLTAVFLYLIFRQLDLPLWYALPIAVGLSLFSPQIARMEAHYGLAHPFLIPMIIYFLLRFEDNPTIWRSIGIGCSIWFCTLFHFYLFIIPLMIVGFYHGFKILTNWSTEELKSGLLHASIQVLIPFLIVLISSTLLDPVTDRSEWPYGYLAYRAYVQAILFPQHGILGSFINENFPPAHPPNGENIIYIGFLAMIATITLLIFCWKFFRRQPPIETISDQHHRSLKNLLSSGLVLLMLSLGIPFIIPALSEYLAYTGPFRQFRSVGRFAWGFYYIINIVALFYGFHLFKSINKKWLRNVLLFLLVAIINIDGLSYFLNKNFKYFPHPRDRKYYKEQDNRWLVNFDSDTFQAMLPVPIYAVGSENIWRPAHKPIMHRSLWASVNTGLPIIGYFMGRTSISQTYKFIELVSPPYREPAILKDFPNGKDILIFGEKGNIRDVPEDYKHIWKNLPHFYEDGQLILYRLPIQTVRDRVKAAHIAVIKESRDTSLIKLENFLSTDSVKNFIYKDFDETPASYSYNGTGAYEKNGHPTSVFFEDTLVNGQAGGTYDISFWLRIMPDLRGLLNLYIDEVNPISEKKIKGTAYRVGNQIKHIDGDWALIQQTYTLQNPDHKLKISIGHPKLANKKIQLDELMIRPVDTYLYHEKEGEIWKGNLRYPIIALPDSIIMTNF